MVISGSVVTGKTEPAPPPSFGCGMEKEGPDGTEGDKSIPTISLLEIEEMEGM